MCRKRSALARAVKTTTTLNCVQFLRDELSSAKKTLRALSGVSGSRRNPLKSIFVVQTSQDGLGQNLMIARNPVSGESLHRAACRRFWYPGAQAGVWAVWSAIVSSGVLSRICFERESRNLHVPSS